MKHFGISALLILLAACAPQDVVPGKSSARFNEYPTQLFDIFELACDGPAYTFNRPGKDVYECRELLPPPEAAATILAYDGYPEDLPQLVIRFSASQSAPGYVVDAELFLNVPQKEGLAQRVVPGDPRINRKMSSLLRMAGGVPITPDAPADPG
ncbi:hypothetical protein Q5Y75_04020 [Ruegeria sp. 2205SS24-7]|uniref:hypothetical protein n=1 Tax=Ruegeria discodermiae TaxID=3064389 RepID=UPI002741180D|nr:hypothetical protein [Ruegeria sp. 2205SS24-7]MDP5216376.1 hypothetical protein [Ruegeria sp. 2205SS24-7]